MRLETQEEEKEIEFDKKKKIVEVLKEVKRLDGRGAY